MLRRWIATVLVGSAALVGGCTSEQQPTDDLMITDNPVAAGPAVSPPATRTPAGTVLPLRERARSLAADPASGTLAVAVDGPPAVLLYRLTDPGAAPLAVPLLAAPESMSLAGGALLVALGNGRSLTRITLPAGRATSVAVDGDAASAVAFGDSTLVAARDRRQVLVLDGEAERRAIAGNLFSADQVLSTSDRAVLLDRVRNGLFELDVAAGKIVTGLRAGEGSTNAVADRFGRVLVADTRGGALLAFSLSPLLMRQRYPVGDAPYGIAYDPTRDLVWVTLTGTNEVVGYHVAGEEPRERFRFPTVTQPNTVTVDPSTGRVFVASANGEGIQVISV